MLRVNLVPAGTGSEVVSPASFPTTSTVSSALRFGTTGAWNNCKRRSVAVPKSVQPRLTTGKILKVSFIVLCQWEFSHRSRYSDITPRHVRCDSVKSWGVFVSLRTRLDAVFRATSIVRTHW